ncbi:hypothetical protein DFR70_10318 [Nocardia tenerifensis]|uniref:Uncharacterized protein n=1 Tax=Nocardia tenerifensis TaxID=228006 RepID=A0A318KGN4_9NOCA|nr:hypothetical protein DFR70_10318 [Nocardia tenerifensis]
MQVRIASAIFGLLILAVVCGWFAVPDTATAKPRTAGYIQASTTAPEGSAVSMGTIILGCLISGAAIIGWMFFNPPPPRGTCLERILSAAALTGTRATQRGRPELGRVLAGRDYRATRVRPEYAGSRNKPKGPRVCEALSAVRLANLLVQGAGSGLAHLHEELEVVLGLLQTVDQQIDRLVRVQAGQYATQLVQHRGLVGVEQ